MCGCVSLAIARMLLQDASLYWGWRVLRVGRAYKVKQVVKPDNCPGNKFLLRLKLWKLTLWYQVGCRR